MTTNKETPVTRRLVTVEALTQVFQCAETADSLVALSGLMWDRAALGRTQRWKDACEYAATEILAEAAQGPVTRGTAREHVGEGIRRMAEAAR